MSPVARFMLGAAAIAAAAGAMLGGAAVLAFGLRVLLAGAVGVIVSGLILMLEAVVAVDDDAPGGDRVP